MDTDVWGGIVICAGGCAIGAFLLWGLATAPRRLRPRGKSVTVRSTGYTGPYSALEDQSTLESCHPASGG